jgi:hypothetical protein
MIPLVTLADLNNYKYVADSVRNAATWPQFVSEAQLLDVKLWLGDNLLYEIVTQLSSSPESLSDKNKLILDGGTYTHQTKTFIFQGLKAAIIYYAFARFTNRTPYNYTAAGIVIKDSDLSTPVSDKIVQRLHDEARLTAEAIRDELVLYLNRNYKDYPLWQCIGRRMPGRQSTFRVVGE